MPSDLRPITSYQCYIITIALSRTETLFLSRWLWSGFSRSPKVKLIMPSDSRPISYYKCSYVTIALSLTDTARNEFLDSKDVGNEEHEELTKIHKLQSSVPTSFCNTGSWPGFSRSLGHCSFEKRRKVDSLTLKTLIRQKVFIMKGFHCILFAVKTLINFSENQHLTFSRSRCSTETKFHSFFR